MTTEPADLRLLAPAAIVWLAALTAPMVGVTGCAAAATTLAAGALVLRARPAVVACLLLAAATAACVGIRLAARDRGPLDELAASDRVATVVGTVAEEPRRSLTRTWGAVPVEQVVVRVRTSQVTAGGASIGTRQPLLVVGQGDGWDDVQFGARIRVSVALHRADPADPFAAVGWARGPPFPVGEPVPLLAGAESMRAGLREAVTPLAADPAGLLPALVVGDTSGLPDDLVADLRSSGLAHLTAVSGANVAIICVTVLLLARWTGVRGIGVPAVGILATAGFVVLARPQPSVLRAAVMGSVAVLAIAVAGRRPGLRALLATVVALLLADPWLARSWGFALSVAATAGLLVLAPRWRDRWSRRLPRLLAEATAVALAAQVATLPLSVALSGTVSLVAIPANLLAAPAVAPATVLGAAAAVVSPLSPTIAGWLGRLGGIPAGWICGVARRAAGWPLATTPWPDGGWGGVLVVVVLVAAALLLRDLRRRTPAVRLSASLVGAVLLVAALLGPLRWPPAGWLVVVCDVGQGDALVLNAGDGEAVVVDVGPDPVLVDRCLDRLGIHRVRLLVLTHDHADHVMGLAGVLDGRSVQAALTSPLAEPEEQAAESGRLLAGSGIPAQVAAPGMSGHAGRVSWRVLGPVRMIRGEGSAANNASVVLLVAVDGVRLLLTGDVEPPAQQALLASGQPLRADVVKLPHHGSANQDDAFLAAVGARLALVSVGADNPYGHPDATVLRRLASSGTVIGRTDLGGDLAVVAGPHGLRLVTRRRVAPACHAVRDAHRPARPQPGHRERGAARRARRSRAGRRCRRRGRRRRGHHRRAGRHRAARR